MLTLTVNMKSSEVTSSVINNVINNYKQVETWLKRGILYCNIAGVVTGVCVSFTQAQHTCFNCFSLSDWSGKIPALTCRRPLVLPWLPNDLASFWTGAKIIYLHVLSHSPVVGLLCFNSTDRTATEFAWKWTKAWPLRLVWVQLVSPYWSSITSAL